MGPWIPCAKLGCLSFPFPLWYSFLLSCIPTEADVFLSIKWRVYQKFPYRNCCLSTRLIQRQWQIRVVFRLRVVRLRASLMSVLRSVHLLVERASLYLRCLWNLSYTHALTRKWGKLLLEMVDACRSVSGIAKYFYHTIHHPGGSWAQPLVPSCNRSESVVKQMHSCCANRACIPWHNVRLYRQAEERDVAGVWMRTWRFTRLIRSDRGSEDPRKLHVFPEANWFHVPCSNQGT